LKSLSVVTIFFILLSFPQFQNDTSNIPREGDEIQYWQIGYGIYKSGEYRRIPISNSYTEQEEVELGYRRGEPVYPFLIYIALKTFNFNNSIDVSNCTSIKCEVFNEEIFALSIFLYFLKFLCILMVYKTLKLQYSNSFSLLLSLAVILILPYEFKDLITSIFLTFGLYYFERNKYFSAVFFGLLPLSNAVFLYVLPVILLLFYLVRKKRIKEFFIMLFVFVLPSFIWMTRNYVNVDEFSITGRGAEVLALRAEYSTLTYEQIGHGFIYYTPGKPFVLGAIQGRLWPKVTSAGSDIIYNRMDPNSAYKKGKNLTGNVGERFNKISNANDTYIEEQKKLHYVSINTIKENIDKHLLLSFVFGYRGLFPPINYEFINYFELNKPVTFALKEIFSILRLIIIPYSLFLSFKSIINKNISFSLLLMLFTWAFYSSATHFIPRYATNLVIPAIFCLSNIHRNTNKNIFNK